MGICDVLGNLFRRGSGRVLVGSDMKDLDQFLEEAATRRTKCACCLNPELAAVIVEFLNRLETGETSVTLSYFHQHYLVPRFGTPRHAGSVRSHVRVCLQRNHKTGEPLDDQS